MDILPGDHMRNTGFRKHASYEWQVGRSTTAAPVAD
jgi:hypothetical protein